VAVIAAAVYCLARGILDLRRGAMAWGICGVASAVVILATPTTAHIISVRIPAGLAKAIP
jgi:hypothetical protein